MSETKRQRGRPKSSFVTEKGNPYENYDSEKMEKEYENTRRECMERKWKKCQEDPSEDEVSSRLQFTAENGNTYFKGRSSKLVYTSSGEEVGRFSGNAIKFF